jgi:hypothetical protein
MTGHLIGRRVLAVIAAIHSERMVLAPSKRREKSKSRKVLFDKVQEVNDERPSL